MNSLNEIEKFKFHGSNYQAFREKLMDLLPLNDLNRGVLDGPPLSSSSELSNKLKQDAKAKAHIRLKGDEVNVDAMKANKWDSRQGKGPFQCYCCGFSDPKHKCERTTVLCAESVVVFLLLGPKISMVRNYKRKFL